MTRVVTKTGSVTLQSVTLGYRGVPAVSDVDGMFVAGTMTAIHGPNGAGKTTLLEGIAGLVAPIAGRIVRDVGSRIAYLPQQSEIDRRFPIDVLDVVSLGTWGRIGATRSLTPRDRERVGASLAMLGVDGLTSRPIASLSTGQFQRVLFARAVVQDAQIIVLDEPFNAIDRQTTATLIGVLHQLHGEGRTVIAVLHDVNQIRDHFEETLLLARRCVAWGKTAEVLRERVSGELTAEPQRSTAPSAQ